jgi:hypothetical protein
LNFSPVSRLFVNLCGWAVWQGLCGLAMLFS